MPARPYELEVGVDLRRIREYNVLHAATLRYRAGDICGAVDVYADLLTRYPDHEEARYWLALAAQVAGELERAEALFAKVVRGRPRWAKAWYNLGMMRERLGHPRQAELCYRKALRLDPGLVGVWQPLGNALLGQGRVPDAVAMYQRAVERAPNDVIARYNRGIARMLLGDWAGGWTDYELRTEVQGYRAFNRAPAGLPLWDGSPSPVPDQPLLVLAEQGLGDTLLTFRYAWGLRERGWRPIWAVPPVLVTLLRASWDRPEDIRSMQAGETVTAAAYIPTMSLPHRFGTTPDTVPVASGYLQCA